MDVYFLRHGQSLFNLNETNDIIDCPLSSLGIEQSKTIQLNSSPQHYSLIICSPLRRCLQTYSYSNFTSDRFEVNDLFREIQTGFRSDLLNENEQIHIDTDEEIRQRILQIENYLNELKEKNVLIICHGDLVWYLTSKKIQGEFFGTWLNNCELFHWKTI